MNREYMEFVGKRRKGWFDLKWKRKNKGGAVDLSPGNYALFEYKGEKYHIHIGYNNNIDIYPGHDMLSISDVNIKYVFGIDIDNRCLEDSKLSVLKKSCEQWWNKVLDKWQSELFQEK